METAAQLAWEAGRTTLRHFQTGIAVELKADATPVTAADREAEEIIRLGLQQVFPKDGVLGEEFGEKSGASGRCWIIDPIDGTKSFIQGVPLYGVLVALEDEKGEVVVGAVYLPGLDEMVHAAKGLGCWWNGRRTRVSAVKNLSQACVCYTSSRSFGQQQHRNHVFDGLAGKVGLLRGWGDCYGHLLVATGRAEVMLDPVLSPWDCAPLVPILQEAGGTFTDWRGEATIRGKDGVSTNSLLFDEVMNHLSPANLQQS
jgi:histidinol phosphatase-like enzyme (inositol monophosphatase family)